MSQDIAKQLSRIHPIILDEFRRINLLYSNQAGADLPLIQFKVLISLARDEHDCCLGDLSKSLDIAPSWASETTDKLVQSGYLKRETHPQDRRRVVFTLTDQGKKVVSEFDAWHQKYFERMLNLLDDPKDHLKLKEGLELLHDIALTLRDKRRSKE